MSPSVELDSQINLHSTAYLYQKKITYKHTKMFPSVTSDEITIPFTRHSHTQDKLRISFPNQKNK